VLTHLGALPAGEVADEADQLSRRPSCQDFDLLGAVSLERGAELVARGGGGRGRGSLHGGWGHGPDRARPGRGHGSVDEAEELQALLTQAGIDATSRSGGGASEEHGDVPVRLLVAADALEAAQDAIEALTEPDDQLPG
jgi:hypothetical protein